MADEGTFRVGPPVVRASTAEEMRTLVVKQLILMSDILKTGAEARGRLSKRDAEIWGHRSNVLRREAEYWESVVIEPSTPEGDTNG